MNAIVLPGALALALALGAMTAAGAQAQPNVEELLVRVGERVAEFYERAKNVICIETSTVQPVDFSNSPEAFVRTVESELHVEADSGQTPGEAAIVRSLTVVRGGQSQRGDTRRSPTTNASSQEAGSSSNGHSVVLIVSVPGTRITLLSTEELMNISLFTRRLTVTATLRIDQMLALQYE